MTDSEAPAAADTPLPASPPPEVERAELEAALAEAEHKLAALHDELLRARADHENQRRRWLRELEAARKYGAERLLADLVQVADNLERGLGASQAPNATLESLREGAELTLRQLSKVLEQHGLVAIDPLGQPFDPDRHQAVSTSSAADYPPGTVSSVLQKGYLLFDRLLRPAMVVVVRDAGE